MIEDLIRGLGWTLLKVVTVGRYTSAGSSAELFEGAVGLSVLAGITWIGYRWLT
jgi:hypothetical protein